MAGPDLTTTRVAELDDVQALVKSGFATLTACRYLMLQVADAVAARAWLVAAPVTTAADLKTRREQRILQVAFTAAGLTALGLAPAGFSSEFLGGMSDPARARRLGDSGASAPERWAWGWGDRAPHVLLMLITEAGQLDAWAATLMAPPFTSAFTLLADLGTSDMGNREPFGFRDGISQPTIDFDGLRSPGGAADLDYGNLIAPGEVLLGYRNEYGLITERPLIDGATDPRARSLPPAEGGAHDLGRNGTYLVFRQLEQDVAGFWQAAAAHRPGAPVALAEAWVGRGLDGTPRVPPGLGDIRGVDDAAADGFTYRADPQGLQCPIGAHVRRANPRTGDMPLGRVGPIRQLIGLLGFAGDGEADRIASSRFHRLLRRGREYGRPLPPGEGPAAAATDEPAGLHFICLAANISRQFEFIQNAWLQGTTFGGLSGEADPLLGSRAPLLDGSTTDGFSLPRAGGAAERMEALPRFVTVKGGAYFFLPGIRALRYLVG